MGKWRNVKQKPFRQTYAYSRIFRHIQTYPDIIRHIQAYSGIIQAYFEPCVTITFSELWDVQVNAYSKLGAYSGLWYNQDSGKFRTRNIFRILGYSEPWDIQNREHTQNLTQTYSNIYNGTLWETANDYKYFGKS